METRKYTKLLLNRVSEGSFHKETLIRDLLNFMSEDDVKEFCEHYDLAETEEETEEE